MPEGKNSLASALAKKLGQEQIPALEEHQDGTTTLMNPTRLAIFLMLCSSPGMCLRDIARRLEKSAPAVKRHLDTLEENGLAASVSHMGRRLLYIPRATTEEECKTLAAFNNPNIKSLYHCLDEQGMRLRDIARAEGISPQLAYSRINILVDAGLVEKKKGLYMPTKMEEHILEAAEARRGETVKSLRRLLTAENLAPKDMRQYKNRLTATITLGNKKENITIYLVPQNTTKLR